MKITAIIPAKGTSRRLPGKNLAPFGSSTLVGHKVDHLLACPLIDEVVVGSDDERILREAALHGADVRLRDAYHCDEERCSANEMIRNLVAMVDCDLVVWAHCTNPLCGPEQYQAAIEAYLEKQTRHDSLVSVTRIHRHAWRCDDGERFFPANFDPWSERHQLASGLPAYFFQDGAIFIQPHKQMLVNSYFYGRHPLLFELNQPHGLDIDTEMDLRIARAIYDAGIAGKAPERQEAHRDA